MDEETKPTAVAAFSQGKNVFITVLVVAVVAVGGAGYFWWQASQNIDPQEEARKEALDLVALVSELIVLPTDEDPVIATVADPERLQDTPFFDKAKIGDKVLIYNIARKAILYDPVEHRIIEVAPLNINPDQTQ